jgi:arylsulfatase A-like enzyme
MYQCSKCGWKGNVNGRQHCLSCYAAATAKWRKENPEKYLAQKARYDKRFRQERPEEHRERRRKYYLSETAQKAWQRRAQWLKVGTVTKQDLKDIYQIYHGLCAYCHTKVIPRYNATDPRGFDHVKSRAQGGKHERSNIVVCCRKCNELKR